jgi:hypothetical protein
MGTKYDYSKTEIVRLWKKHKGPGYAQSIAAMLDIPAQVVHNVIYWHRRKKAEVDRAYRQSKAAKSVKNRDVEISVTRNYKMVSVWYVGANIN